MVRYTAKDLVKAARQIADLENSDFISWNENIRLMNEAYTALYQKLINKGDQNFVVSFTTKDREIDLPFDFWQLKNVSIWNNGNVIPILKRSASTSYNSVYYEIRNNVLFITGNFTGDVLVEYWPAPVELYYPPEAKDLGITLDFIPQGAYDKKIIYKKEESGNTYWHLYDVESGTDTNLNIKVEAKTSHAYIHKNYILFTGKDSIRYTKITDYSGNIIFDSATIHAPNRIPIIYRDSVYDINADDNSITFRYGTYYSPDNIDLDISKIGTNNNNVILYFALDNGIIGKVLSIPRMDGTGGTEYIIGLYVNNNSYANDIMSDYLPQISGNTINTVHKNMMSQYDTDLDKELSIATPRRASCISKIDDNTGYGFYTTDGNNNLYIESFLENTCLDFPNSFYFEILSYILADAYKAKQGADDSQIVAKLSQMEQVFYDSLGSDAYGPIRITNVY